MASVRKSTRKKRQTQLTFTPLPSSSPVASHFTPAAVRYGAISGSPEKKRRVENLPSHSVASSPTRDRLKSTFGMQKVQVVLQSPSEKIEAGALPTPAPSSQVGNEVDSIDLIQQKDGIKAHASGAITGEPMNEISTPLDKEVATLGSSSEDEAILAPRGRRAKATPAILSSDESSGSHLAPEPVTPKKRARPQRGFHISTNGSTIGSSSEKPRRKLGEKLSPSPSSATATSHKGHITEDVADKSPKATLSRPANTFVISSGSDQSSSEDDVITPARKRRPTLQSSKKVQDERSGSEESGELAGEVADLSDTELQGRRTRGHQANSERSKRQRRLEELRQRRAGVRVDTDEESVESPDEDESQDGLETIEQAMGRRENLNEYEDDFVDDEEDAIGVDLGVAGVPLKYTYHANKKPFEHFKTEIEWMVHNKLNPAFDRRDEIYLLAHDKLDKEVEGYGKSKFESSVWKEPFLKALKSRPDFDNFDVPTMLEHKCDACQRSNHPPKHRVTFTGKPYDRDTLEPITNDDEEDESESDEEEDDSRGSSDEQESFFLGRFCCANAEMVHALHHWRWHLNQTVLLWLGTDGHLTPEKIVERESMRQKKREKEANRVVDGMESTGVMKELYCQFKQNLAAARDAKPERFTRH